MRLLLLFLFFVTANASGCTILGSLNFDPAETSDDGSCVCTGEAVTVTMTQDNYPDEVSWSIEGVTDTLRIADTPYNRCLVPGTYTLNLYDSFGDGWSGGTITLKGITYILPNGLSSGQHNITITANTEYVFGCTNSNANNYDSSATYDDGSCIVNVAGCTDANYLNYDPSANVNDGSCATIKVEGCTDSNYLNYNALATFNDGSCATIKAEGCTDANYVNYDASANYDDGSCGALIKANFVDNTDCNALKNAASSACGVTKDRVCIKQTVYN